MKVKFLTIQIGDKCYGLPRDMQIPQIGSRVFIENTSGIVEEINYHFSFGEVFMISIFAKKE